MVMRSWKLLGTLWIASTLTCSAYENRYTEMTAVLRQNAKIISQTGLQHLIEWHQIFPQQKKFPFQVYGSVHHAWQSGDQFRNKTALALVGCHLSYHSPLLRRAYALGLFGGGARDRLRFSGDSLLKRTRIEQGFFGYSGHFRIWGLEITSSTLLSLGSARTDLSTLPSQKHRCRTLHSQYSAAYLWDHNDWSFGPMVGLLSDQVKYHGAKNWDQRNFHASDLDGIAGAYLVHDGTKLDFRFFLGGQHNLRHREHGGALTYNNRVELPKTAKTVQNHFLLSANCHYALASHWLLTVHFSGSYHKHDKFTAAGFTLDHIF